MKHIMNFSLPIQRLSLSLIVFIIIFFFCYYGNICFIFIVTAEFCKTLVCFYV